MSTDNNKEITPLGEVEYLLDNLAESLKVNIKLNKSRADTVNYSLCGEKGIGKTAFVKGYAKNKDYGFYQVNLAEQDDTVDLGGYPRTFMEVYKDISKRVKNSVAIKNEDGSIKAYRYYRSVDSKVIDYYINKDWKLSNKEPQLVNAKPAWLDNFKDKKMNILYLDDYNRALPFVLNSIMELLNTGSFKNTWKLPLNTIIVLSENPDEDGNYNVGSLDEAQDDRVVKLNVVFDLDRWVKWATRFKIQDEFINFIINNPELTSGKNTSIRKWTRLFRSLSHLKDLRSAESILKIQTIGTRQVGDHINLLVTYLHNKLYDLITPKEILTDPNTQKVLSRLKNNIYTQDDDGSTTFRQDISAILALRLKNYIPVYADEHGVQEDLIDRLEAIIATVKDKDLFHADSTQNIITVIDTDPRFTKLVQRDSVFEKMAL